MAASEYQKHTAKMESVLDHPQEEQTLQVRLFGDLELENFIGCVSETPDKLSSFLLLKYLLCVPTHDADQNKVLQYVWNGKGDPAKQQTAFRVRLARVREVLSPLKLDGAQGLITYTAGTYRLNPDYKLVFDTEEFLRCIEQLKTCPEDAPESLNLCARALEIYRGLFLTNIESLPWVNNYRNVYRNAFCDLVSETLKRLEVQDRDDVLALLCTRALLLIPEHRELQMKIIRYLLQRKPLSQFLEYVTKLHQTGKATWLIADGESNAVVDRDGFANGEAEEVQDAFTVQIRLLGQNELKSKAGCIQLTPGVFKLLSYFLLKPDTVLTSKEILQLWPGTEGLGETAIYTRFVRAKEMLKPLMPEKKRGLFLYKKRTYRLNPEYTLDRDLDRFYEVINESREYAPNQPEGLSLCVRALMICKGQLMQGAEDLPWVKTERKIFHEQFIGLLRDIKMRMAALIAYEILPLLCQRTVAILQGAQDDMKELVSSLEERAYKTEGEEHTQGLPEGNRPVQRVCDAKNEIYIPSGQSRSTGDKLHEAKEAPKKDGMGNFAYHKAGETEDPFVLRVKLFGDAELQNGWGKYVENRARKPKPFQLIKYLFLKPKHEAAADEVIEHLWPAYSETSDVGNAARVRLHRSRNELASLHLNGTNGLLQYSEGRYWLNPDYRIIKDTDVFEDLINLIKECPVEEISGIELCAKALELYRGPFLEYTKEASWNAGMKEMYHKDFCYLAESTLQRLRAVYSEQALEILCKRAAALIPEAQGIHEEILHLLKEHGKTLERMRHIMQLEGSGRAKWLDERRKTNG